MDQNIFLRMNTGAHTSAMGGFLVTSDRSQLVSMSIDKTIRVWDPISQRGVRQFRGRIGQGNDGGLSDIALTPNDQYLLSAVRSDKDDGFNLRIFDFKSGELVKTLGVWAAIGIHFSADQRFMLITDYYNKRTEIYDYHKFLETLELDNSAPLHTIDFSDLLGNPRPLCFFQVGESYRLLVALEEFGKNEHSLLLVEFDAALTDIKRLEHIETPNQLVEFAAENGQHIVTSSNTRQVVVRD
ncbi:MAG: WD40 repeat domain-containing protein, partial [Anaerolineae bacterium]